MVITVMLCGATKDKERARKGYDHHIGGQTFNKAATAGAAQLCCWVPDPDDDNQTKKGFLKWT